MTTPKVNVRDRGFGRNGRLLVDVHIDLTVTHSRPLSGSDVSSPSRSLVGFWLCAAPAVFVRILRQLD